MRSSIARGALVLLSVAAMTGCQSGTTWSPTWWNPFHTTSTTTPSNTSLATAPPRPSTLATTSPGGYGSSSTANPYSTSTYGGTPASYNAPANQYGSNGYGTAATAPGTSTASGSYPGSYGSATPGVLLPRRLRRQVPTVAMGPRHPRPAVRAGIRPWHPTHILRQRRLQAATRQAVTRPAVTRRVRVAMAPVMRRLAG